MFSAPNIPDPTDPDNPITGFVQLTAAAFDLEAKEMLFRFASYRSAGAAAKGGAPVRRHELRVDTRDGRTGPDAPPQRPTFDSVIAANPDVYDALFAAIQALTTTTGLFPGATPTTPPAHGK